MLSRRRFLQAGGGAVALAAVRRRAYAFQQSPAIRKFNQALPGLGPSGIPVASPVSAANSPVDAYQLEIREFQQRILPPPYGKTTFWGYVDANPAIADNPRYLGPVIVARKDKPVQLIVTNKLPNKHILPVDTTLMGAEPGQDVNRTAVHLHGGFVTWNYDGGPFAWFAPDGRTGVSFLNGTGVKGQAQHYYPNQQSARLMWYHDHAIGITRLNAYAGIASAYLLGDDFEDSLVALGAVPSTQIPLVIQDKSFKSDGSLWYPSQYEYRDIPDLPEPWGPLSQATVNSLTGQTGRWESEGGAPPLVSCVPEYFSDTILVNGAVYPVASVPATQVRFRILNASQARFYNLQLYYESAEAPGEADLGRPGPPMIQIGTEGGFLFSPVVLNNPPSQIAWDTNPASPTFGNVNRYNLLLAPAERADLIIDFASASGKSLILYNDAPAPFPGGDQRNDYFTGDLNMAPIGGAPPTLAGQSPNTRTLLKFTVGPARAASGGISSSSLVFSLTGLLASAADPMTQFQGMRMRDVTLNEDMDQFGRLIQRLGTNTKPPGSASFGRGYMDPATETPRSGDVEIWRIFNLTGDTHPIHFHLVNVQVLGRQPFDAANYTGTPKLKFIGPFRGPDPNEFGYKETVRVNPNEMTMVIIKFQLPKVPFAVPQSPRTGGYEYVWHCHILEHEEHDMMRPLVVSP
jgi:spore coat protein A